MLLRVVDHVASHGGGVRFVVELLAALARREDDLRIELVSSGAGLARYSRLVSQRLPDVRLIERRPRRRPFLERRLSRILPRSNRVVARLFGVGSLFQWEAAPRVCADADAVWFPWVHLHAPPPADARHVVGSYHDTIMLQFEGIIPPDFRQAEWQLEKRWLESSARVVVSSEATKTALGTLFGPVASRVSIVRLSARHAEGVPPGSLPAEWTWANRPFVLCPANTTPHKNHETLLAGFAAWSGGVPLVLCGGGTDLESEASGPRGAALRAMAAKAGLVGTDRLVPLGYVTDDVYYALLKRAWALVMPTLAEGGGSFPVMEAMQLGVPVVCSDIPVLREQVAFYGGKPLWFEPLSPLDLAARMEELRVNHAAERAAAMAARAGLARRAWDDVANDYLEIFTAAARSIAPKPIVRTGGAIP